MKSLTLSPTTYLRPSDVEDVAFSRVEVFLSDEVYAQAQACSELLHEARQRGESIYGLTTGFGPLVEHEIYVSEENEGHNDNSEPRSHRLQKNLIYHLASGTGPCFSAPQARAIMFARLSTLSRGHSAVTPQALNLLVEWLNRGLAAAIPSLGSVGASGDLTPLAHMALAMMGEGEILVDGKAHQAREVLAKQGISHLFLNDRDGLALVNGTSATLGLSALAFCGASRVLARSVQLSALFADTLCAQEEAFDPLLGTLRPHRGQVEILERLRGSLQESQRIRQRDLPLPQAALGLFKNETAPLQDPYSIRCIPQMLGAVQDQLTFVSDVIHRELESVTDNPLFEPQEGRIIHGGNFFGQHLAMASDLLNQALITAAILAERQIARITDPRLSPFPAFLQPNDPGLQSGLMGAQVTASSLIARLRSRALPLAIQSVPTNGNNQDVNPMATLAALQSEETLERVFEILAILGITLVQASYLEEHRLNEPGYGRGNQALLEEFRSFSPPLLTDRPLSKEIQSLANYLAATR